MPWLTVLTASGIAAAQVDSCTEEALATALLGGGTVTFGCSGTILLEQPLKIEADTVIDGSGQQVVLDGGGRVRIFEVQDATRLELRQLTLVNGFHAGADANPETGEAASDGMGGAVWVGDGGHLLVSECVFEGHQVRGGAGAGASVARLSAGGARGGAIHVGNGTLHIEDSVFSENQADGGDGGGQGLTPHETASGRGGAVYHDLGESRMVRTRFVNNRAQGSLLTEALVSPRNGSAYGGALYAGAADLLLDGCQFLSNRVNVGSAPRNTGAGEAAGGAVYIGAGPSEALIRESTFESNVCPGGRGWDLATEGRGGAIASLRSWQCRLSMFLSNRVEGGMSISAGAPGKGGAIWSAAPMAIEDCTFLDNSAVGVMGQGSMAVGDAPDGSEALGGAVFVEGATWIRGSAFARNQAVGGPGNSVPGFPNSGGGDGLGGAVFGAAPLAMWNCTLIGNEAFAGQPDAFLGQNPGNARGGAIHLAAGPFGGTNLTLVGNRVVATDAGGTVEGAGFHMMPDVTQASLINTILFGNEPGGDWVGTFETFRSNLTTAGLATDGVEPRLGTFGDYGGPTWTVSLLEGSPAIDAGESLSCPETDQRGVMRPVGAGCDLGAFEFTAPYLANTLVAERKADGRMQVVFAGEPDQDFVVETSTDLVEWRAASTNQVNAVGLLVFGEGRDSGQPGPTFLRVARP
ncbi:MAG: hypothetical protein KF833_15560 [Verrucomicrobiae bacterium]|nr:hypothetical protein [Verrucomicrobiae bacterium]